MSWAKEQENNVTQHILTPIPWFFVMKLALKKIGFIRAQLAMI